MTAEQQKCRFCGTWCHEAVRCERCGALEWWEVPPSTVPPNPRFDPSHFSVPSSAHAAGGPMKREQNGQTILTASDWNLIRALENSDDAQARDAVRRWAYHAGIAEGLRAAMSADAETLAEAATWPTPAELAASNAALPSPGPAQTAEQFRAAVATVQRQSISLRDFANEAESHLTATVLRVAADKLDAAVITLESSALNAAATAAGPDGETVEQLRHERDNWRAVVREICAEWSEANGAVCDERCDSYGHEATCKAISIAEYLKSLRLSAPLAGPDDVDGAIEGEVRWLRTDGQSPMFRAVSGPLPPEWLVGTRVRVTRIADVQ